MRKDLIAAAVAVVAFTLLLGVAYPLVVTGVAQVAFGAKADGSLVRDARGRVTGSSLIGEDFAGDPRYFQSRPSATDYAPSATFFSNRPPNSAAARAFYREQLAAYLALNGRYSPGLTTRRVPVDAVTTSASGVDPHISEANARIQAARVASVRRLPAARVAELVDAHTDRRFLGVLGEPGVDVAGLNAALDGETR